MLGSVRLLVVGFLLLGVFSWSGESVAADSERPAGDRSRHALRDPPGGAGLGARGGGGAWGPCPPGHELRDPPQLWREGLARHAGCAGAPGGGRRFRLHLGAGRGGSSEAVCELSGGQHPAARQVRPDR